MIPQPTAEDLGRDAAFNDDELHWIACEVSHDLRVNQDEAIGRDRIRWNNRFAIRMLATIEQQKSRAVAAEKSLLKINEIRNSIIGLQTTNWSEHIYPLACALDEAGFKGMEYPEAKANFGTMLERLVAAERERDELRAEVARLKASWDEARDTILNQRHECEEPCLDSDQTNAVLSVLDRCRGEA